MASDDDRFKEIKKRWSSKEWPTIGYFVHGQAYMDIHELIKMIEDKK